MSEKKQTIKEPLASLGDRIIAYIIDFFVMQIGALIGGILILIGWAIIRLIDIGADVDDSVYSIVLTIVGVLAFLIWMAFDVYYLVFWLVRNEGQTIGKRIKKIRIMIVEDLDTGKIRRMNKEDIGVVLLRLVFSIIDALLFGLVGIYLINSNPNRQRFADQQAKTVVILDDKE